MKDLVVLTADAAMRATMDQLLTKRQKSLGIHPIEFTVSTHLQQDSGCLNRAPERLVAHRENHRYALVLFDRDGCGREAEPRESLQNRVEQKLHNNGWADRSKAIVIDPELEAWVWNNSPHTANILGWGKEGYVRLQAWLRVRDLWPANDRKPPDPKEAYERALKAKGLQKSASRFVKLAGSVGLKQCEDPAFGELRETLAEWFPA